MRVLPRSPSTPPADAPASPAAETPEAPTWTIAPGDHLWHVAEATLGFTLGRPPRPAAIATYLDLLIDQNLDVLAVPGQPDLVFPGQVFTLPPVPQELAGAAT